MKNNYPYENNVDISLELLHDAIGLLMNHDQHMDAGWIADYEEVLKKYEEMKNNEKF